MTSGAAPVISAVYVSGATVVLPLPRQHVEALLTSCSRSLEPRTRLLLDAEASSDAGLYPVLIDLWRLTDGRLELAGLTQHQWSELAYATGGATLGAAVGALRVAGQQAANRLSRPGAASLQSALLASLRGGLDGARAGLDAFGRMGRALSENSASALGNYVEVMFSLPGVRIAGPGSASALGPFTLSLGVYTDSQPACAIDKRFRYGLGKTLATVELTDDADSLRARVIDAGGREVLSARLRAPKSAEPVTALRAAWLEAPLLGIHGAGRSAGNGTLRTSTLRRRLDQTPVRPVEAEICLPFGPFGLPNGDWRLSSHAIAYSRVWSEISLPAAAG